MFGSIFDGITNLLKPMMEKWFPDPKERDKATLSLVQALQEGPGKELQDRVNVIVAEAKSKSWLTRTWRPITMLCFVAVIVNNYMIVPYAQLFGLHLVVLNLPGDVWGIVKLGLGGYVIGRSGEKITSTIADAVKQRMKK